MAGRVADKDGGKDAQDTALDAMVTRNPAKLTEAPDLNAEILQRVATLEDVVSGMLGLQERLQLLEADLVRERDARQKLEVRVNGIASRLMLHLRQEHKIVVGANL